LPSARQNGGHTDTGWQLWEGWLPSVNVSSLVFTLFFSKESSTMKYELRSSLHKWHSFICYRSFLSSWNLSSITCLQSSASLYALPFVFIRFWVRFVG
jgi:hypothetical protein